MGRPVSPVQTDTVILNLVLSRKTDFGPVFASSVTVLLSPRDTKKYVMQRKYFRRSMPLLTPNPAVLGMWLNKDLKRYRSF